jgi:hypothetical protein
LEAYDHGKGSLVELAERFGVSLGWAWKISSARKRTGRIDTFQARLLKHWTITYGDEVKSNNLSVREFRRDQTKTGPFSPRSGRNLVTFMDYCHTCGLVEAKVWAAGQEYSARKTIGELHRELNRQLYSMVHTWLS